MDDFNEGNNFYDDEEEEQSLVEDILDINVSAKDLKGKYNDYKSSHRSANSSLNDNGKAFRDNMRASNTSRAATQSVGEAVETVGQVGSAAGQTGAAIGQAGANTAVTTGGTAAGGTAAGGTAAGGAAAGGAAAGGTAAAGVSATGIGAIVVAAIGLLAALKNLAKKIDKKAEELTGQESKNKKWLILGIILLPFLIILFIAGSLFVVSDTTYTDTSDLIKRREERYGKPLMMFTDDEYNETINKDYDNDLCYKSIVKSYGSDLLDTFLVGLDTKDIYDDDTLSQEEKNEKALELSNSQVKKYLKAERENFNKIIWNASGGYNAYSYTTNQSYGSLGEYNSDTSGYPQISANNALISSSITSSTFWWELPDKINSGLDMYEIKDQNGKGTGLKIPTMIFDDSDNKDEVGKYYVDLLEPYLQKWVIPYTMMIDSQDKEFIDRVMNEMYHRVDVNVYKLSQEVKTTTKNYYMKAISYDEVTDYIILEDGSRFPLSTTIVNKKEGLNTRDNKLGPGRSSNEYLGTTENDTNIAPFLRSSKNKKYRTVTTIVELDPANQIASEGGQPMVKQIDVTRNISQYKSVPKIVNIESFYEIIKEQYKVSPINEANPANVVGATNTSIDSVNGILTESFNETWYEELEQVGQTEKKEYSVSYYTEEEVENLGRKISRVEWAQDYGNPNSTISDMLGGATGGDSGTIEVKEKTYKLYNQGSFSGNIPAAGCGLTSTCMVLSAYRPDLDLNPDGLASQLGWTEPRTISNTARDLEYYGVTAEAKVWSNFGDGWPGKKTTSYNDIKANLQAGRPVIIQVKGPCPYTSCAHYMVLVAIDESMNVTIADSAGGVKRVDTLSNMVDYMYDNAVTENGYVLIKSDKTSTKTTGSDSKDTDSDKKADKKEDKKEETSEVEKSEEDLVKEANSKKITEMLQYGASLAGKVPYVWGGGPYSTKEQLESGVDCSGFAMSLYNIFFNVKLETQLTRVDIFATCENVDMNGLKGKQVYNGGGGTPWNSEIESVIRPGDIVWTAGHITIYAGDIKGDGTLYTISQGGPGLGPTVEAASAYYSRHPIKGISRFVGDASIIAGLSSSGKNNGNIYPIKTRTELLDAYNKYGSGHGYSYDDMYFAYYHIEQYYGEINELNGHSLGGSNNGPGLGWPIDIKKYPGCEIINCFYGYTPAYGSNHSGIDISSGGYVTGTTLHIGPDIIAAHDGKVIVASSNPISDANAYTYVQIQSEDGKIETQYGHLSKIMVKQGDTVKKGDVIGKMGNTGESTGTHLHYAIFENGTRVDPLNYYVIAKEGSDEEVDYSKIDKNSIVSLPTGYKFLRSKGGGSQALLNYIYSWEGSDEYLKSAGLLTSDEKYYIIYADSIAGTRAVGHGIDLDAGGYAPILERAGYSTSVGSRVDKDFIDELSVKEIETNYRAGVVSRVSGLNLKEYQIDALTSRAYNMGVVGAVGKEYTALDFVESYKKYWNESKDNLEGKSSPNFSHPLYTNYMQYVTNGGVAGLVRRRKSEWRLFQTGNYEIVD